MPKDNVIPFPSAIKPQSRLAKARKLPARTAGQPHRRAVAFLSVFRRRVCRLAASRRPRRAHRKRVTTNECFPLNQRCHCLRPGYPDT